MFLLSAVQMCLKSVTGSLKLLTYVFLNFTFKKRFFFCYCKMKMNIEIVEYENEDNRDEIAKHFDGNLAQMPTKLLNDCWNRIIMSEWSVEGILVSRGTHINLFPGKTQPHMLGALEDWGTHHADYIKHGAWGLHTSQPPPTTCCGTRHQDYTGHGDPRDADCHPEPHPPLHW